MRTRAGQVLTADNDTKHHALNVDFSQLLDAHCELAHVTLAFAERLLPLFDEALLQAQQQVFAASSNKPQMSVKPLCHARYCCTRV